MENNGVVEEVKKVMAMLDMPIIIDESEDMEDMEEEVEDGMDMPDMVGVADMDMDMVMLAMLDMDMSLMLMGSRGRRRVIMCGVYGVSLNVRVRAVSSVMDEDEKEICLCEAKSVVQDDEAAIVYLFKVRRARKQQLMSVNRNGARRGDLR